ncbi:hypothetical protein HOF78_02615 [Candidatus Woesearchaeota archaeon]|jgi:hypothetical protein|nr:hypothetical protein [Candidatus Woesearchaeota archaeon]MBT6044933.1 hypothetical protein [Candidatus Woesearchaeota archaeon]
MVTNHITDIGTLANELGLSHKRGETISFMGTFIHRRSPVISNGRTAQSLGDNILSTSFKTSGELDLTFMGDYDPNQLTDKPYHQEISGNLTPAGKFSHRFFLKKHWKLYHCDAGDQIASSLFVPSDDGFESAPFVWAHVIERVMPLESRTSTNDGKYFANAGEIRIYTEIPDGIQ